MADEEDGEEDGDPDEEDEEDEEEEEVATILNVFNCPCNFDEKARFCMLWFRRGDCRSEYQHEQRTVARGLFLSWRIQLAAHPRFFGRVHWPGGTDGARRLPNNGLCLIRT